MTKGESLHIYTQKISSIIPVLKFGAESDNVKNYRSISIQSHIAKQLLLLKNIQLLVETSSYIK